MSEDVRKQLRTQGRYSDKGLHTDDKGHHKHREKRQKVSPVTKVKSEEKVIKRNSNGGKDTDNSLMDDSLSPVVKYEEKSPYAFSQLDEKKPIEIMDRGKRVLSSTENGESIIYYEPQFLSEGVGNDYFEYLEGTIAWHSKNIVIQGNEYPQPRLVAWFGPFPYSYSGTTLEPAEMPDKILEIKRRVEIYLEKKGINATFNSVLLNLYRNGKDSVSWHSDDELTMGISPTIASVSLGETRKFEMRKKMKYLQYEDEESSNQTDKYFVHLTHGSLLIMTGCMQDDWQHRVPKEYHDKSARINLTFRTVHRLESIPEEVFAKEVKKEHTANYCSSKTSSPEFNLEGEYFPPLNEEKPSYLDTKFSTHEKIQCSDDSSKKVNNINTYENWDIDPSEDEQTVQDGEINKVQPYSNTCAFSNDKYEDVINENNRSLSSDESCINDSGYMTANGKQENNLDKELTECHNIEVNTPVWEKQKNVSDKKDPVRRQHNVETNIMVTHSQRKHFSKPEALKWCDVEGNTSVNHYHRKDFGKKEPPKNSRNMETFSTANNNRENNMEKKRFPRKWNDNANTRERKLPPRMCRDVKANSPTNVIQENNLDRKESSETWHNTENGSPVNITQENNLDKKEFSKTGLNVEAKEFIPISVSSYEKGSQYSEFNLEALIYYKINLMHSTSFQDFARTLKAKVLERIHEFRRFTDREELQFLCELTDGSQSDKNQKLISQRMCNIVIKDLERSQTPSNAHRSYDVNSRQHGYGNQSHYSDKGRRYQNQGRSSNHRH